MDRNISEIKMQLSCEAMAQSVNLVSAGKEWQQVIDFLPDNDILPYCHILLCFINFTRLFYDNNLIQVDIAMNTFRDLVWTTVKVIRLALKSRFAAKRMKESNR